MFPHALLCQPSLVLLGRCMMNDNWPSLAQQHHSSHPLHQTALVVAYLMNTSVHWQAQFVCGGW
jgi:hypothetical protein